MSGHTHPPHIFCCFHIFLSNRKDTCETKQVLGWAQHKGHAQQTQAKSHPVHKPAVSRDSFFMIPTYEQSNATSSKPIQVIYHGTILSLQCKLILGFLRIHYKTVIISVRVTSHRDRNNGYQNRKQIETLLPLQNRHVSFII